MRTVKPTPPPESVLTSARDLGRLMRAARTATGLTLEEAALSMNVAKQTLQNLETGTGTVSLSLAFKAVNALGIRLTWQLPPQEITPGSLDEP